MMGKTCKYNQHNQYIVAILMLIVVVIFLLISHSSNIDECVRDSEDVLLQIWIAELTFTTIVIALITVSLSAINKKLYGIRLIKVITFSTTFWTNLLPILFIDVFTYFPVIFKNFLFTSIFYFIASSLSFYYVKEGIDMLAYPEKYERLVKRYYINKVKEEI